MSLFSTENKFISVKSYYSLNFNKFKMEQHIHDNFELMYVVDGSCRISIEDKEYKLNKGRLVFIDNNIPHSLNIDENSFCSIMNLEFTFDKSKGNVDISELKNNIKSFSNFLSEPVKSLLTDDKVDLKFAIKDLILELEKREDEDSIYVINLLIKRVLIEFSRCVYINDLNTISSYVLKARAFILDNLDQPLEVSTISQHVHLNKSYLQKLFKKQLNISVIDFINKARVKKAELLLLNSSNSIVDIAFEVGYNSRQHFAYTFEKYYGLSPGKYRVKNFSNGMYNTNKMKKIIQVLS